MPDSPDKIYEQLGFNPTLRKVGNEVVWELELRPAQTQSSSKANASISPNTAAGIPLAFANAYFSAAANGSHSNPKRNVRSETPAMSGGYSKDETDAKIENSALKTELKISRLDGKIDLVLSEIGHMRSENTEARNNIRADNAETRSVVMQQGIATRANIWAVGVGLAGVIVALFAIYPAFFGLGTQVRDMVDKSVEEKVGIPQPALLPPIVNRYAPAPRPKPQN